MNGLKHKFIELFSSSGWSQAEVARRLEMTRGGVNGIVTGDAVPSPAAVKLFEMILESEGRRPHNRPAALHDGDPAVTEAEMSLLMELRGLQPDARELTIDSLRRLMKAMPKVKVSYRGKNSPKPSESNGN